MCKPPSKVSPTSSTTITEHYTYDNNANCLSQEVNTTLGTHNQEDQLKSYGTTEYSYSTDGYLQTKTTQTGTTTYEYSIFGELKSVTLEDTTLIEYKHNANHQRVAKYINKELKEKYLWLNLTTLLATYDKENNLINRYSYTNDRVPTTLQHNNQTYHLLYNHQGSLRAVVDEEGTLIKELHYNSFGTITLDTNPDFEVDFGFAGGLYDKDTKLTRFGYRDYDAQTGKWTAKDPIGFSGGDTNLYGYVLQDPVNFVDPTGEFAHIGAGMLAGAAIGGITAAITTPNGGNYTSNILTGIVLGAGSGAAVASGTWVGLLLGIIVESGNVANACR
jgi:RHS repeat-associated protein